ncbi:MAG: TetR/AcrR family transcriptional regulator [Edaphocola sp.]
MNRKQSIADSALTLFAGRGYENTSTQLISKEAGVSEALIFKHFGNKEKLLAYIIKDGYKRIVENNRGIFQNKAPLDFVFTVIDLPYKLVWEEPQFWELQYRLLDMEISLKQHERFMQPLNAMLVKAFRELGYAQPEKETELMLVFVEAFWKYLIAHRDENKAKYLELQNFFKTKYTTK